MLNERKKLILETIIQENIKSGQPVSSVLLVDKYALNCSSATVRNEMSVLEEEGWIYQPHTSAGRLQTEEAWRWFIANTKTAELSQELLNKLAEALTGKKEEDFKRTAKLVAAEANVAIFWAFHRRSLYYTGISNLLSQPELSQPGLVCKFSVIIDRLDEIIADKFDSWPTEPAVLLGENCPFGPLLGAVTAKYFTGGQRGLFGIIGPLRQDYAINLAIINNLYQYLNYEKK